MDIRIIDRCSQKKTNISFEEAGLGCKVQ